LVERLGIAGKLYTLRDEDLYCFGGGLRYTLSNPEG
jgi:hypothetical protein